MATAVPLPFSLQLCQSMAHVGSEEPVCRASHNRGCRGSRATPPTPQPWGSINISQIRLQKNTVFIRDLCKLWRRVSPSILCGEPFLSFVCIWCLTEVCLLQTEEGYRPSNKQSQLIRVCRFQMWDWNHTNWTEAVFWFHGEGWRVS